MEPFPHLGKGVEVFACIAGSNGDDGGIAQVGAIDFGEHASASVLVHYHRHTIMWCGVEYGVERRSHIVGKNKVLSHNEKG